MPYTTKQGQYDDWQDKSPDWWTNSFWCGTLWLLYGETGQSDYREWAESIERKMDKVLHGYDGLHHDVGFMWLLSSVNNYSMTGSELSRKRAMTAASILSSRFHLKGSFIQAWNGSAVEGWAIIDCMMNIPILYWATKISGDTRFCQIANAHADTALRSFIRDDGSTHHIVAFNPQTGEIDNHPIGQGCESGSSWTRGQGWAIYGFAQAYHATGNDAYLHAAKRTAHYFLSNLA